MIERYKIYPRGFGANTYVLTADGERAVVIDPSGYSAVRELSDRDLTPAYVLLTHCHFDHVMFVSELQKMGAKVVCLDKELPNVNTEVDLFSMAGIERKPFTVDQTVSDGETFTLAGVTFTAYSMSGHTSGSAVYSVDTEDEKWLFTGDVLFQESIGRTDFPTGSLSEMRESLRRLKSMDGEYKVFSGHGDDTTLDTERQRNVFLQDV